MEINRLGTPGSEEETLHFKDGDGSGLCYRLVSAKEPVRIQPTERARLVTAGIRTLGHDGETNRNFLADFVFDPNTGIWKMNGPQGQRASFYPNKAGYETNSDYVFEGPDPAMLTIKGSWAQMLRYGAVKKGDYLHFGSNFNYSMFMAYKNAGISRTHFGLSRDEDELLIIDLNSTNGSYLAVGPSETPLTEGPNGVVEVPIRKITEKHKAYINGVLKRNGNPTL